MTTENNLTNEIDRLYSSYPFKKYEQCLDDWDYKRHDVFSKELRPDDKVLIREETDSSGRIISAEYKDVKVARLAFPLERDIVNIHTSFAVGQDPDLGASPKNIDEEKLLEVITATERRCKMSAINKSVVRSFLSECMVAEYWYSTDDEEFYPMLGMAGNGKRLKCTVFSPFRGDKLMPEFDSFGNLVRFNRMYSVKDEKGNIIERLNRFDDNNVETLELSEATKGEWEYISSVAHGFGKIPIIFMERSESLTEPIREIRNRLEFLSSNYADCVDYNFAPKIVLKGDIVGAEVTGRSQMVQITGDADIRYLTWQQSPEHVKLEMDNLIDRAYQLTNTPRISLRDMQGAGNGFSGESFRYVFMGTHMAVRNHEEIIGEYLTRRYNFLIHAIISHLPSLKNARTIALYPTLSPYVLDSLSDRSNLAVSLYQAGLINKDAALRYIDQFDAETDKGDGNPTPY